MKMAQKSSAKAGKRGDFLGLFISLKDQAHSRESKEVKNMKLVVNFPPGHRLLSCEIYVIQMLKLLFLHLSHMSQNNIEGDLLIEGSHVT